MISNASLTTPTLPQPPRLAGRTMELALTARTLSADEAYSSGLVSRVFADRETLDREAVTLAQLLAKKPAVALAGTKRVLLHARQGCSYVAYCTRLPGVRCRVSVQNPSVQYSLCAPLQWPLHHFR